MTFLRYVAERLLGPPTVGLCWRCPFCSSPHASFSVRPPKANYPIKFRCFRCDAWGDEYDLLKLFYPDDDYAVRRNRVEGFRSDYATRRPGQRPNSLRGRGVWRKLDTPENLALAMNELTAFLEEPLPPYARGCRGFRTLAFAKAIADETGVRLSTLARRCAEEALGVVRPGNMQQVKRLLEYRKKVTVHGHGAKTDSGRGVRDVPGLRGAIG